MIDLHRKIVTVQVVPPNHTRDSSLRAISRSVILNEVKNLFGGQVYYR